MSWLSPVLLFVATWIAVFAQTQFAPVAAVFGAPPSVVPALLVYAALRHSFVTAATLSVVAGLWLDSLSATRLGVSILPLFALVLVIDLRSHLLLRDQLFAQYILGAIAGLAVPFATLVLIEFGSRDPIAGWGTLWQILASGLVNGAACPLLFRFFESIRRSFEYQPVSESAQRANREIKYGKQWTTPQITWRGHVAPTCIEC